MPSVFSSAHDVDVNAHCHESLEIFCTRTSLHDLAGTDGAKDVIKCCKILSSGFYKPLQINLRQAARSRRPLKNK